MKKTFQIKQISSLIVSVSIVLSSFIPFVAQADTVETITPVVSATFIENSYRYVQMTVNTAINSSYSYDLDCSNFMGLFRVEGNVLETTLYADDVYSSCTLSATLSGRVAQQSAKFDFDFRDYFIDALYPTIKTALTRDSQKYIQFTINKPLDASKIYSLDCDNFVGKGTVSSDLIEFGLYDDDVYTNCVLSASNSSGKLSQRSDKFGFDFRDFEQKSVSKVPPAGFEDEVLTLFSKNPFPDTDINTLEGKSAAELYRRAVIGGFPDGQFKGERFVNRAEAAKFLLLARYGSVETVPNNSQFKDVMDGQWYTSFVVTAAKKGIINGYADGTFRPGDRVNTAEFLKMLTLTFELTENQSYTYTDVSKDSWFARYAGSAARHNLFPNRVNKLNPEQELTRDEVSVAIYQYLSNR